MNYNVGVLLEEYNGEYEKELCINGRIPLVICPKCEERLYAGTPKSKIKTFYCEKCNTRIKPNFEGVLQ